VVKLVKELKGYSESSVHLMYDEKFFVRKTGDIHRNIERYDSLTNIGLSLPKIYNVFGSYYDMEYISCLEMKKYLSINPTTNIVNFLKETIDKLKEKSIEKDYTETYEKKLSSFDFSKYDLPFTCEQLIDKLPKTLPWTEYHGDLTLENVLYDTNNSRFVLIDPLTTEYDSYIFDLAKIRQDLVCKWFIRNDSVFLDSKLQSIYDNLKSYEYFENNYLLILMLMRVLPYTKNEKDKDYLMNGVKKLWK
jgi:hypothetical protein